MLPKQTPRPRQEEKILAALREPTKAVLIGDDPGLGKTLIGAEVIVRGGFKRVLVVGIKDTYAQWAERLGAQSEGAILLRRIDSSKAGQQAWDDFMTGAEGHFFIGLQLLSSRDWTTEVKLSPVTGEPIPILDKQTGVPTGAVEKKSVRLKTYAKIAPVDMLVVDEIHLIAANRKSNGFKTLFTFPREWIMGLSGTVFGNKFENFWAIGRVMWPEHVDASFIRWRREYCTTDSTVVRGKEIVSVTGEREPGRFASELPCFIRDEAEEPPAPTLTWVDLTPPQRAQYHSIESENLAWLEAHTPSGYDALITDVPIAQRQRLRTATLGEMRFNEDGEVTFDVDTTSAKLQRLGQVLHSPEWRGQKALIFLSSKAFAYVATERMRRAGERVEMYNGDTSSKKRDEIKDRFINEDLQYIVGNIVAMGTGLDGFQAVCSRIVWLEELEGNPSQMRQARDRVWRPGVDVEAFQQVKILARDTLDEGVFHGLQRGAVDQRASMRAAA